ncbi:hypothetical protein HYPBUDRAFT_12176 [Hyphopichia burtonii NRRL Y-1933]|uniref:PCI domain-containing protein n=1 Tax=Hyphopichia burtonii NRRL Y-1933 TaxID=984485 RepID=A0A1E4RGT7_9ASCO|nr:hypothetical protein HYPBUDRAFT_12176 [Hyphopichia burtonii NRRL Y-1933]ODV66479.1 hypothetical protein HYPBUDRAFT_12176 [Hyphopichia burtonii NRRL Y-1933]
MTSQAPDQLNVSFLRIPRLANQFDTLINSSQLAAGEFDDLTLAAQSCLELMDQYKTLHPSYQAMIDHLNSHSVSHKYSGEWISSIEQEEGLLNLKAFRKLLENDDLNQDDKSFKFDEFKKVYIHFMIKNDYQQASYFINLFSSFIQFQSQAHNHNQLVDNRYVEFFFYQFILQIYSQLWFPNNNETTTTTRASFQLGPTSEDKEKIPIDELFENEPTSSYSNPIGNNNLGAISSKIKNYDNLLKKINFYYAKNEILFNSLKNQSNDDNTISKLSDLTKKGLVRELKFFWLIKWLNVILMFEENDMNHFLENCYEILLSNSNIPNITTLEIIFNDFEFKSELLSAICLASIFTRPFKELTLMNDFGNTTNKDPRNFIDQQLIDLIVSNDGLESSIYQLLLNISELNTWETKAKLLNDQFILKIYSKLGYLLPSSNERFINNFSNAKKFIYYLNLIIDFKNFLLILSVSSKIPRLTMLKKLGYKESQSEEISNDLLALMSILNLGEQQIGYNSKLDYFFNDINQQDENLRILKLQKELNTLSSDLESDSFASLMRGILTERFFS